MNLLYETITKSTEAEYNKVLNTVYSKDFVNFILQSDQMAQMFTGKKPAIETTGNILVKYSQGNGVACILGLLSKNGHITKSDYKDIMIWGNKMKEALQSGETVMTSLNQYSKPIMLRFLKDIPHNISVMNKMSNEYGTWESVMIEAK